MSNSMSVSQAELEFTSGESGLPNRLCAASPVGIQFDLVRTAGTVKARHCYRQFTAVCAISLASGVAHLSPPCAATPFAPP